MSNMDANNKRPLTDRTGQDVINILMETLNNLTVQDSYKAEKRRAVAITDDDEALQKVIEYGQDPKNCIKNQRGLSFDGIYHGETKRNFPHSYVVSEPWLFFWRGSRTTVLSSGESYLWHAVGCINCHAAANILLETNNDDKCVKWSSTG